MENITRVMPGSSQDPIIPADEDAMNLESVSGSGGPLSSWLLSPLKNTLLILTCFPLIYPHCAKIPRLHLLV
jgi:hypothetical protein